MRNKQLKYSKGNVSNGTRKIYSTRRPKTTKAKELPSAPVWANAQWPTVTPLVEVERSVNETGHVLLDSITISDASDCKVVECLPPTSATLYPGSTGNATEYLAKTPRSPVSEAMQNLGIESSELSTRSKLEMENASANGEPSSAVDFTDSKPVMGFSFGEFSIDSTIPSSSFCELKHEDGTCRQEYLDYAEPIEPVAPATVDVSKKLSCTKIRKNILRFMICEWFYSDIDRALLLETSEANHDFAALLETHFPALRTRALARAEWNHIRRMLGQLGGVRVRRRCSGAFFHAERCRLEQRRKTVRLLQDDDTIQYLVDDLPPVLPSKWIAERKVYVQLNKPLYGVFEGTVVRDREKNDNLYLVRFPAKELGMQYIPDYRLAVVRENTADETVPIPQKLLRQIRTLEEKLKEKQWLLDWLINIRENTESRRKLKIFPNSVDCDHAQQYIGGVQQVISVNRSVLQLTSNISTALADCMGHSVFAELIQPEMVLDEEVIDVAKVLEADFERYCEQQAASESPPDGIDQVWRKAERRLLGVGQRMDALRRHIQRTVGK